jgi:hypothetical protein
MGVVYLARNRQMDRLEVLKVMGRELLSQPGARQRFEREIRSAARLNHPNVVAAYSVLSLENLLVFAMEYVEGEDLAKVLKARGPLPVANACYCAYQAALGLQHALDKQMVHRDIKPQNLILTRDGKQHVVKILDFGLAKARGEKGGQYDLTGEGKMLGTPHYIAPEQIRDAATADIRADIYSLGCTLYALLTGEPPFAGGSLYAILHAHQEREARPLTEVRPDLPGGLAAVVRKMMAKDPAQRYQTPAEVARALVPFFKPAAATEPEPHPAALTAAGGGWETLTEPATPRPAARPVQKRRRIGVLVLAAVLLAGLAAAGILLKVKTKDGTLVVEVNEPNPDVHVVGEKVSVGGAEIRASPGNQVEEKKGGLTARGEEVTPEDAGRRVLSARVEQSAQPPPAGGPAPPFFNGNDLTGWTGLPGYWHVEDGAIVGRCPPGRAAHTFLFSDKSYKDFDLSFRVHRRGGIGNSGVQFRSRVTDPERCVVVGPQCEIDSRQYVYPPGSLLTEPDLRPLAEKARPAVAARYRDAGFNDFHIRCVGKHVTIEVNGVTAVDGDFPSLPDEGVIAWQIHGRMTCKEVTFRDILFADLGPARPRDGFFPLFNGKDLSGWKTHPQEPGNWRVENGILTGSGPETSHLYTERSDYKDFHLRVEARINAGGNSGVFFRSGFGPAFPARDPRFPLGYEAQIRSPTQGEDNTGSLYAGEGLLVRPERDVYMASGEWFTMEVLAEGDRVTVKVGGRTASIYTDEGRRFRRSGHIALQQHDRDTVAEFRKIEIKELPATPAR